MIKTLLKKEFLEFSAFFTLSKKDGKRRSPMVVLGFAVLMLYAFGASGAMFYLLADTLCVPLVSAELSWVYFALVGVMATGIACIVSAFGAKMQLYEAKDNDLLLSMPIKPWQILFARLVGLYAITWLFTSLVFVPSLIVYFVHFGVKFLPLIFSVLLVFILPFGALAIACFLGWLIAFITSKIRAKNLFTTLFTVAFLIVYMVAYSKIGDYLQYVIANGDAVGAKMKTALWVFYQFGLGMTGDALAFSAFTVCFGVTFALVYLVLAKTFLRLATANRGGFRKKYTAKKREANGATFALFKREALRFFKNPMVIMNCSLGSILLLIVSVYAFIEIDFCRELASLDADPFFAMLLAVIVCGIASTNIVTASSVSLEGKTIWQLQSLPIDPFKILIGKLILHFCVSAIPALVCVGALCALLKIGVWYALLCAVTVASFVAFCAISGLFINLKMPNLHFSNEVTAVKQSMSVLVSMFVNIGVIGAFIGGYFWFGKYLPEAGYIAICLGVLVALSVTTIVWLKKRGARIFAFLQS